MLRDRHAVISHLINEGFSVIIRKYRKIISALFLYIVCVCVLYNTIYYLQVFFF